MPRTYPEDEATDRTEMQCPECFTTGLEANTNIATQYETERDRLVYATCCPSEDCDVTRVPPSEIRHQLKTGFSRVDIGRLFRELSLRTVATFTAFVLLVGAAVLATGGLSLSFPFGTSDTAVASTSYGNLTTGDSGPINVSNETGNWTIYEYGGHYVVSAKQNGTVVYLTPNGNVTTTPYVYDTRPDARNAILAWSAKHDKHPSRYPTPDPPNDTLLLQTSNWTVFEYNGSYVIAGRIDGSLVYLLPNGTYSERPYVYANLSNAKLAIIHWETHYDQFPSQLPGIEPVTVEEVQRNLDKWDPDGSKWPPTDQSPDDYEWDWDWWNDTESTTTLATPTESKSETESESEDKTEVEDKSGSENESTPKNGSGSGNESKSEGRTESENEPSNINTTNTSETQTAYTVQGSVTDSHDKSVEGATVHLHSKHRSTTTGPDGSYTFENVMPGDHIIYVEPPNGSSLAATESIVFTMTDHGEIHVKGDPSNVVYFETSDGTVAENTLQLLTRQSQPIHVRGTGSALQSVVRFDQPLNAKDTTVTLTGVHTATEKTTTLTGHETKDTVSIDGNTDVRGQQLSLKGVPVSKTVRISGTYRERNPTVPIQGNLRPRDVHVTLSANLSTNRVTDNGQLTLNTAPTKIALAGSANANWSTSGESKTNAVGRSGTYEIAVSWSMSNGYYDAAMDGVVRIQVCSDGDCETIQKVERNELGGYENYRSDFASGTITATATLEAGDTIRVQSSCSCGWDSYVQVSRQVVATYQGSVSGTTTVTVDGNLPPKAASITLTGMESVATSYETPGLRVDGDVWSGDMITDESVLFYAPEDGYYHVSIPWKVKAYTMGTWGDDIGGSAELSLIVDGQSVLSKDAYTFPGEQEVHSGTYNTTVYLEQGAVIKGIVKARDAGIATVFEQDSGVVTRSNTGQVTVSVNNETKRTTALTAGESQTLSIPLTPGENRITVTTSGGRTVKYAFEYVQRNGTTNPAVHIGGQTVCSFSGVFDGQKTCDVPRSELDASTTETFNITTAKGPVNYTIGYQARAVPSNATVTIDGTTYNYPEDFSGSGPLATQFTSSATRNISALSLGENDVHVSVVPVDGLKPSLVARLLYRGEQRQTTRPMVIVESATGTIHTKTIPESALTTDGKLHGNFTMTLPADWFTNGDNVVRVRTPDASQVRAVLESSGLRYQNRTFNETATTSVTLSGDRLLQRSRVGGYWVYTDDYGHGSRNLPDVRSVVH